MVLCVILPDMLESLIKRLKEMPDNWQRRLYFAGILTKALESEGIRPIIVGGHAVEFYTLGGYATRDIDIAVQDRERLNGLLSSGGFKKEGRHWYSEELDMAIEAPASELAGDAKRVTEVEVEGLTVYIIGIEDIIIDRLNAFVHWKSQRDGDWAEEMLAIHHKSIDLSYLNERAEKEETVRALKDMLKRTGL